MKVRAIYIGDVQFDNCPVFELKEDGWFEMLIDSEFRYEKSVIESDINWLVFNVDVDECEVKLINNL